MRRKSNTWKGTARPGPDQPTKPRTALARAEAAYADASQRLAAPAAKPPRPKPRPTSCRWKPCACTQLAEQTRAAQRADRRRPGRGRGPVWPTCKSAALAAEARFEELDMQLADTQEREAQLDDRVIEAERKLAECREQQRSLERPGARGHLCPAQPRGPPGRAGPHAGHRSHKRRLARRSRSAPRPSWAA